MYKKMISTFAMSGMFFLATSNFASAQGMKSMHRTMHKKVSLTGCLTKGDEAGEYNMKTDGKLYGLTSKKVQLKDHVGHQVMLKGFITPESAEAPEANEKKGPEAGETGGDIDVTVTGLKMISTSCTQ